MELPFSSFELTFIIVAFVIFSLFGLASVCVQPQEDLPGTKRPGIRYKQTSFSFSNTTCCLWIIFQKKVHMKRRSQDHLTRRREWSPSKLERSHKWQSRLFCRDPTVLGSSHQDDPKWLETSKPCCPFSLFWNTPYHCGPLRLLLFLLNSPYFQHILRLFHITRKEEKEGNDVSEDSRKHDFSKMWYHLHSGNTRQ